MRGMAHRVARRRLLFWAVLSVMIVGCSGSGVPVTTNSDAASIASTSSSPEVTPTAPAPSSAPSTPAPPASVAPITIQGTPATNAVVGSAYVFQPSTSQSGSTVVFYIANEPAWAYFSSETGGLAGIPLASDLGTTHDVTITVSNGTSSAAIGPFDVTVTTPGAVPVSPPVSPVPPPVGPTASAALAWQAPTQNTDGSPLTNLAGYHINYGTSANALISRIAVPGAGSTAYVVSGLAAGSTYFFAVTAYDTVGVESAQSNVVSKTL